LDARCADVDYKGGGFAMGEAVGCVSSWLCQAMNNYAYAASTPVLPSQKAGTSQSSNAICIALSLDFALVLPGSLISNGLSLIGFSPSSTPSISASAFPFSLSPFVLGSLGRGPVSLDVMAYSHNLAAVSQSCTHSSDVTPPSGFNISRCESGVCRSFSPNRVL